MNDRDRTDNCKYEFDYAFSQKTDKNMQAVVTEASMKKNWSGAIGGAIGGTLFVDLSMSDFDKDPQAFQTKCDELLVLIRTIIKTTREEDNALMVASASASSSSSASSATSSSSSSSSFAPAPAAANNNNSNNNNNNNNNP